MNFFNRKEDTTMAQKVANFPQPLKTVEALPVAANGATVNDSLEGEFLAKSYYAVEEPFVVADSLPRGLSQVKELNPLKSALNFFDTFEQASAWAQKINRPLIILEIKPAATCKPQMAAIERLKVG